MLTQLIVDQLYLLRREGMTADYRERKNRAGIERMSARFVDLPRGFPRGYYFTSTFLPFWI